MRVLSHALFAWLLLLAMARTPAAHGADAQQPADLETFPAYDSRLELLELHYQRRSDLQAVKGSGWKPYNRLRWLFEGRRPDSRGSPGESPRWRAARRSRVLRSASWMPATPRWKSLGPTNIAGRILSIEFHPQHPDTMYAGSASGGLWRSLDAGESWTPVEDDLPTLSIGAVALLPSNPNTIILGTGEPTIGLDGVYGAGILRSVDGGDTWQPTNVVQEPFVGHIGYHAIRVNPLTETILAAGTQGLLRSVDGGATWSAVVGEGNWTDVAWRPGSRDSALAFREFGGMYLSADGGLTFQLSSAGLPVPASMGGLGKIAWSPGEPQVVYAGLAEPDTFTCLGIFRSTDGGATWTLRSKPTYLYGFQGFYNNTIAVDPLDAQHVYAAGISILSSTDGAATWNWIGKSIHVDHHAIAFRPDRPAELWVGTDGGLFRTMTGGSTWENRNQDLVTLQLYDACAAASDPSRGYGGTQDNGTLRFEAGPSWAEGVGGDGMICHCDPADPDHVYGEVQFGHPFASRDGLKTWDYIEEGLYGRGRWVGPIDLDPRDPMRLVTATSAGIFETRNGGALWARIGEGNDVVSLSISPVTSARIWAQERSNGKVRTSVDGGATWSASMAAPFVGIGGTKILADPSDSLSAVCTYLHHPAVPPLILRTKDGGLTWNDVTGDLGEQAVHTIAIDPANPGRWYVGTDVGVWRSIDGGATWTPFGEGLPNVLVLDLEFRGRGGELRAATHGRGLWTVDTRASEVPAQPDLFRPYLQVISQNPARGEISFRFGAPQGPSQVLSVFGCTGNLVARVTAVPADGTIRTVEWSAQGLPAGVYFAALRAGSKTVSKKIVLLR